MLARDIPSEFSAVDVSGLALQPGCRAGVIPSMPDKISCSPTGSLVRARRHAPSREEKPATPVLPDAATYSCRTRISNTGKKDKRAKRRRAAKAEKKPPT